MDFFDKEEYNIDDITALINNEAEESVHLEFKAAGALGKDGVKGNKKINGKLLQGKIVENMPYVNRK